MASPDPEQLGFWGKVFKEPNIFIAWVAVTINTIISFLNVFLTVQNQKSVLKSKRADKQYDLEFTFYRELVLNSIPSFVGFASFVQKQFDALLFEIATVDPARLPIEVVTKHIDILDKQFYLLSENLPSIRGYCPILGKRVAELLETIYDGTSDVFSKITYERSHPGVRRKFEGEMAELVQNYTRDFFKTLKEQAPSFKN